VDKEPQFYLRKQAARFLPLGPAQRTAINLAIPYRGSVEEPSERDRGKRPSRIR
jgi:hypothetical protein